MKYKIDTYIGESHQEQFNDILLSSEMNLIVAPTNAGKTSSVKSFAKSHPDIRVALLCPTQTLVDNLKQDEIPSGYGSEFIHFNQECNFIITTWDSIQFSDFNYDILVVDEAHLLAGHASFRAVVPELLKRKKRIKLITGTPDIIECLPDIKRVDFIRPFKRKEAIRYSLESVVYKENPETKKEEREVSKIYVPTQLQTIFDNWVIHRRENIAFGDNRPDSLLFIRVNDKSVLRGFYDIISEWKELNVVMYYSGRLKDFNQKDKVMEEKLKSGDFRGVDVVLCTSIYDAGLSFTVDKNLEAHCIATRNMPNPIDMVQFFARLREGCGYEMSLTLYGDFGLLENVKPNLSGNPHNLAKTMGDKYEEYAQFNEENYKGYLERYGIRLICKKAQSQSTVVKTKRYLTDYELVKFLNHISREFGLEVNKPYCTDTPKARYKMTISRVKDTIKLLDMAEEIGLTDEVFLNDTKKTFNQNIIKGLYNVFKEIKKHYNSPLKDAWGDFSVLLTTEVGGNKKINLDNYRRLTTKQQKDFKPFLKCFAAGRIDVRESYKSVTLKRINLLSGTEDFFLNLTTNRYNSVARHKNVRSVEKC